MSDILNISKINNIITITVEREREREITSSDFYSYPIINFIFPFFAASSITGIFCLSYGPNIPWGLIATVNNTGPLDSSVLLELKTN